VTTHIGGEGARAAAASSDFIDDRLCFAQRARHHQHVTARRSESQGDAPADAFAAAGDDDAATLQ
jgi:hypothetical protein